MADVLGLLLVMLIGSRKGLPVNVSSPALVAAPHRGQPAPSVRREAPCEYVLGVVFFLLLRLISAPLGTFLSEKLRVKVVSKLGV